MQATIITASSLEDFTKQINTLRKTGKWFAATGELNGKQFTLKGYGCWLQVYKVNGIDCSNGMGDNVKGFTAALLRPFGA